MDYSGATQSEEEMELRRGPWTVDEDMALVNYISINGEGRWNTLSRSAGLNRTGKSCRLRWLNYLRPEVRRGNITLEEQLLILELHSRWGNRWSKIAQHLPGRTDNEIKNYWRTRVQKHAKQLKCDVNSKQFKDTMRYLWIPRLVERIQANAAVSTPISHVTTAAGDYTFSSGQQFSPPPVDAGHVNQTIITPENYSPPASSDSFGAPVPDPNHTIEMHNQDNYFQMGYPECLISPSGYNFHNTSLSQWVEGGGDISDNLWNVDDIWLN